MSCGKLASSTLEMRPAGSSRGRPITKYVKGDKDPKPNSQRPDIVIDKLRRVKLRRPKPRTMAATVMTRKDLLPVSTLS